MGIDLELLALKGEKSFDMETFYKDILSIGGDYDPNSYSEPSEKFEDLLTRWAIMKTSRIIDMLLLNCCQVLNFDIEGILYQN